MLAAPLPYPLTYACYGSDGHRFVVAGGIEQQGDGTEIYHNEVLVLEGVQDRWVNSAARLNGRRAFQSGVLVGDFLICIGGKQFTVSSASGSSRRLYYGYRCP